MDPITTSIHATKLVNLNRDDVTGAGSGVGIHLVQYLKYLGIKNVFGLSSKSEKLVELGVNSKLSQRNVEGEPITLLRPALTIMRQQRIVGSASYTKAEYEEAIRRGGNEVYELEQITKAYKRLMNRQVFGRAVLKIMD